MKNAIDLYSGIGGWTLGMKLSGINNIASYEWWHEANGTHNINFGTKHKEVNIREIDVERDLNYGVPIDFVVGSPPCTQFSYANKGGNGDLQDGLIDIYKFLEVVDYLKPKYWAMENVPRVAGILKRELSKGALQKFKHLVSVIEVVDAAEYGVPQNRKRMIAGDFPFELFSSYRSKASTVNLRDVIESLNKEIVVDVNYGYSIPKEELTELEHEAKLTKEEERINRDAKTYHPIYNNMSFPDKLDRPSRTVTATCTRVSRESIIIKSSNGFRRLSVRERGIIQGFPITYQFYGRTLNAKFKMIGNAVPPILTYFVFQSMLEVPLEKVLLPKESKYYHHQPKLKPYHSKLGLPARKYPVNRKFMFSVPHFRYGSGVRFELSNNPKAPKEDWSFKFFYGNSKKIQEVTLNKEIKEILAPVVNTNKNFIFDEKVASITTKYKGYDSEVFQKKWINSSGTEVFDFLDEVGDAGAEILQAFDLEENQLNIIKSILDDDSKKVEENAGSILVGFYFLSSLNKKIFDQ